MIMKHLMKRVSQNISFIGKTAITKSSKMQKFGEFRKIQDIYYIWALRFSEEEMTETSTSNRFLCAADLFEDTKAAR